nr:phosphotransferase [Actinopolymorpha cephalotaxi]
MRYTDVVGESRDTTVFVTRAGGEQAGASGLGGVEAVVGEGARYEYLAGHGVPTPRLLAAPRGGAVVVLEFLPTVGIEPAEAGDLLSLIARVNAVDRPPLRLFEAGSGLPQARFDALVEAALCRLADDHRTTPPVEVDRWMRAYRLAAGQVATCPTALNHGELGFQQVGWSGAGDARTLVVFDLETMAIRPRFTDIATVLGSLAALTGLSEPDLFAEYLGALREFTGQHLDEARAWAELRTVRVVVAFESLPWLAEVAGHPDVPDAPGSAAVSLYDDLRATDLLPAALTAPPVPPA